MASFYVGEVQQVSWDVGSRLFAKIVVSPSGTTLQIDSLEGHAIARAINENRRVEVRVEVVIKDPPAK